MPVPSFSRSKEWHCSSTCDKSWIPRARVRGSGFSREDLGESRIERAWHYPDQTFEGIKILQLVTPNCWTRKPAQEGVLEALRITDNRRPGAKEPILRLIWQQQQHIWQHSQHSICLQTLTGHWAYSFSPAEWLWHSFETELSSYPQGSTDDWQLQLLPKQEENKYIILLKKKCWKQHQGFWKKNTWELEIYKVRWSEKRF